MKRLFSPVRRLFSPVGRFFGRRSKLQLGAMFVVAIGLCSLALFNKSRLIVNLKPGEQIQAEFASNYKLREYVSRVKIAGIKVGTVTRISRTDDATVLVNMRVEPGTNEKLGQAPAARIRPATILGGSGLSVYVDLRPGGGPGPFSGQIPTHRTGLPVGLDRVLEVFTDVPRQGLSSALGALDEGLANGGGAALSNVADQSPAVLPPGTEVVKGLLGQSPGDLAALVDRLGRVAATLTDQDGEIESVLSGGATATRTLGRRAADFEALLAGLPADLTQARKGLDVLTGTLGRIEATAPGARAAVQRLGELLTVAAPVLAEARPLLADTRPLLAQLDPLFSRLAPTASRATGVLSDFDGDVIGRIRNPILTAFTGPYGKSDTMLYQEFAFFLT
ncbi:MAG: MlaD family protein, partial [Acidimicrobiia bacterium]